MVFFSWHGLALQLAALSSCALAADADADLVICKIL